VKNDPALNCLENENQLAERAPVPTGSPRPELVVWQLPDDQQYFYVVATTPASAMGTGGCAAATLAFVNPAQATAAVNG
jgi:hypothetical protein